MNEFVWQEKIFAAKTGFILKNLIPRDRLIGLIF